MAALASELGFLHQVKVLEKPVEGLYLGLDPSETGFGVAVLESNELWAGHFACPKDMPHLERLHSIECTTRGIATILKPKRVTIENYSFGSSFGVARSGAFGGAARLGLYRAGVQPIDVAPMSLKVYATGIGKGKKDMVMLATGRAGIEIRSNDEADACWLCLLAASIDLQFGSAKQLEVAAKVIRGSKAEKGLKDGN